MKKKPGPANCNVTNTVIKKKIRKHKNLLKTKKADLKKNKYRICCCCRSFSVAYYYPDYEKK